MSCATCARWKRLTPPTQFGFCLWPELLGGRLLALGKPPYWRAFNRSAEELLTHATHGDACAAFHPRKSP